MGEATIICKKGARYTLYNVNVVYRVRILKESIWTLKKYTFSAGIGFLPEKSFFQVNPSSNLSIRIRPLYKNTRADDSRMGGGAIR